jgi:hypothetical protein
MLLFHVRPGVTTADFALQTMAGFMSSCFSQAVAHTMKAFLFPLCKLLDLMDSV